MNLAAVLTTAAPWVGFFAFLTVAEANRAAVLAWCRVIGGGDPPQSTTPPPVRPRRRTP